MTNHNEQPLTVSEIAKHLKVSENTVYLWVKAGRIKGRKIGGLWRFYLSEVRAQQN